MGGAECIYFGRCSGANSLASNTTKYDLSSMDDVVTINNIRFDGEVQSASLAVTLLDTQGKNNGNKGTPNESFFDFSGGFESFAILTAADASTLSNANIGLPSSGSGVSFSTTQNPVQAPEEMPNDTPAGPVAPLAITAILGAALLARQRRESRSKS